MTDTLFTVAFIGGCIGSLLTLALWWAFERVSDYAYRMGGIW
jgi:hypothetical protein